MPRGGDRRATYQARRSGAAVDIDLATMPVLAWSATGAHRIVFRTDGIDPATTHSSAHQLDKIRPQALPLISPERTARLQRIKLMTEQHLGTVDVAHPDWY